MEIYVALEGFTLRSGFIVKELCVMFLNGEYNIFLFQPPVDRCLSHVEQRTVCYTTRQLNNLSYEDGDIPYETLYHIISKYSDYTIFTFSDVAQRLLQEALPSTKVTNIQSFGFNMPAVLPPPSCCRMHNPRYCALAKCIEIKNFIKWFN